MRVFAYHWKDSILVALAIAHVALLVGAVLTVTTVPLAASILLGVAIVFLMCTNYQCVAHNFIHNPFFSREELNQLFSILNSLCIGVPESLYRMHHLHHHRYNNDAKDPATGTTNDITSTFRYGKNGEEEGFLTYSFLGFFRSDFTYMWNQAKKKGLLEMVVAESIALGAFFGSLVVLNWRGVVFFLLPVWYLGQVGALAENYMEHHGAIPGDRRTDSVSSYGRLYNWIWFNNGYHQEHHLKPQVHWTEISKVTALLPPETKRRVVRGAHWFNFFPPRRSVYQ